MRTFGFLLGPPLLAALLALVSVPFRRAVGWTNACLSLVSLGAALALGRQVLADKVVVAGGRISCGPTLCRRSWPPACRW